MTLANYCYKHGYTLDEYRHTVAKLEAITKNICEEIDSLFPRGMIAYMPFAMVDNTHKAGEFKPYVMQLLKKQGVLFADNETYFIY